MNHFYEECILPLKEENVSKLDLCLLDLDLDTFLLDIYICMYMWQYSMYTMTRY